MSDSPESSAEWSDAQVLEALQGGAAADEAADAGEQATPAPVNQGTPAGEPTATPAETQAAEQVAPEQQNVEAFDNGKFNPDELPEELQQGWKQLQAAFTLKTQELARERQQIAELGDFESLQQARDLFTRISDPASWPQLHAELSEAMQTYGMSPAEMQAATEAAAAQTTPDELGLSPDDDPELAPLLKELRTTQAELKQLKSTFELDRQTAAAEYERQALLGEMQRQINVIQTAHPTWDDDKMKSVVALSSFYNGNLMDAANHLDRLLADERALYLKEKAGVAEQTGRFVPPTTAGTQSHVVREPETVMEAEAGAIEMLRALMSND